MIIWWTWRGSNPRPERHSNQLQTCLCFFSFNGAELVGNIITSCSLSTETTTVYARFAVRAERALP